jgi:hypothetical protein
LNRGWAFQADSWRAAGLHFVELTQVYRQSDREFIGALMRVREAKTTAEDWALLDTRVSGGTGFRSARVAAASSSRAASASASGGGSGSAASSGASPDSNCDHARREGGGGGGGRGGGAEPTALARAIQLRPTNAESARINDCEFSRLVSPISVTIAEDWPDAYSLEISSTVRRGDRSSALPEQSQWRREQLDELANLGRSWRERSCLAPERFQLRLGARVLLLTNVNDKLVNGMLGVVERWATPIEVEAALVAEERKPAHVTRCVDQSSAAFASAGGAPPSSPSPPPLACPRFASRPASSTSSEKAKRRGVRRDARCVVHLFCLLLSFVAHRFFCLRLFSFETDAPR